MRKGFIIVIAFSLLINAIINYHVLSETSLAQGFASRGFFYSTLSLVDYALIVLLAFLFQTQWRQAKKMQQSLNASIADIRAINNHLKTAQESQVNRIKMAVHDIKNPLGAIKGFAELIADEAGPQGGVAEMSQIVQRISNETLTLVNSLLAIDAPANTNPMPIDISEVVSTAVEKLRGSAQKKGQTFKVDLPSAPLITFGRHSDFESVALNLISNALKFSPRWSKIRIGLERDEKNIFLSVQDEGPGFSEADQQNAFRPGAKLTAKPTGGETSSGMGLFSVKETVDQYSGSIRIENLLPGAKLTVGFPILADVKPDQRKVVEKRVEQNKNNAPWSEPDQT
jgi:signal transduction histidine kinase